mmetsp:Transcript_30344/g.46466  ORF Transcript_30344/g.46466 Transcript_30344/m.46466 type:complete len:221 (+) Transcript_30344:18-680(+)
MLSSHLLLLIVLVVLVTICGHCCQAFSPQSKHDMHASRRDFVSIVSAATTTCSILLVSQQQQQQPKWFVANAADNNEESAAAVVVGENLNQIRQARKQLDNVPDLIQSEKWDSVRAILITPPLSDCWAKTSRPLLLKYAESLGDLGGDELAALEAKEDANSHLRYLDMAVYNNIFNPIKSEGETGATKLLIKSYYEDPVNEWKASIRALDDLIDLAKQTK